MNFSKVRPVKTPNRGEKGSAGIDFYVPEFNHSFFEAMKKANEKSGFNSFNFNQDILEGNKYIILDSLERVVIPSGIKCDIPEGYMLCAYNKSGMSVSNGTLFGAGLVDESWMGEIGLVLFNVSKNPIKIYEGQKIFQFTLLPVYYNDMIEVPEDDLFKNKVSDRGEKGFGEGTGRF